MTENPNQIRMWEEFDKRGRPLIETPMLTIQKTGGFYFNEPCRTALGGEALTGIVLMFEPNERLIGARAAKPDETNAYRVTPAQARRDAGFVVSGRAFCKHHEIPVDETRRFTGREEDGVLVFEVGE
jgi:hypothetical protein